MMGLLVAVLFGVIVGLFLGIGISALAINTLDDKKEEEEDDAGE